MFTLQTHVDCVNKLTVFRLTLNKFFYTAFLSILTFYTARSQITSPERFVQLSGIITDVSYRPVAGVAVISRKLHRGTLSERSGIYSITSTPGDTVFYRALGYKRYHTVIPESYQDKHCMVDIVLEADTIPIAEVTILPWSNYNEFIRDMTKEKPVDPIIENMNENLASIYVSITNQTNLSISPEAGYRYAMEQNFSAMATRNQYPVNNLFNPFAWSRFISEVKKGLLRNHSFTKPVPAKVIKKKKKKTDNK
jgi:hypothetical protein